MTPETECEYELKLLNVFGHVVGTDVVRGRRVGDFAVRRASKIQSVVALRGGLPVRYEWTVDHIPTGVTLPCDDESEAAFFADEFAALLDGIKTERELDDALDRLAPWTKLIWSGERIKYRHWLAARERERNET